MSLLLCLLLLLLYYLPHHAALLKLRWTFCIAVWDTFKLKYLLSSLLPLKESKLLLLVLLYVRLMLLLMQTSRLSLSY
jgi:hypothetical protein